MKIAEYADLDAMGLATLIRNGAVTPGEVVDVARRAISAADTVIAAVVDGPYESPLAHSSSGPLAGVPFALKDLGAHARERPSKAGSRLTGDGITHAQDSYLVEKYRNAGLAILALTATPEFGLNTNTAPLANPAPTRNPWRLSRSAGGSSGGSAALVASGALPAAHGNDGGGSIRVPASFNGLVGLKPSRGRISNGPDRQELLWGMATEGHLTRTVRDTAVLLDVSSGYMPGDKYLLPGPGTSWLTESSRDPGKLRIAVHAESWSTVGSVEVEVRDEVLGVARHLEGLGHHVSFDSPTFDWDELMNCVTTVSAALCAESVENLRLTRGVQPDLKTLEHTTLKFYELGKSVSALELSEAMHGVSRLSQSIGNFFTQYDVLLTPTTGCVAPPIDYLNSDDERMTAEEFVRHKFDLISFTPLFNYTGTPAISIPAGRSRKALPVGVQLASGMGAEGMLLQLARQLEEAVPWSSQKASRHVSTLAEVGAVRES